MSQIGERVDFDAAMRDPAAFFHEPKDVSTSRSLSRDQKLALLRRWEREARSLAVAEEEGMTGGKPSMLGRVRLAIQSLGGDGDTPVPVPDKHGGQIT